jgi:hypothetical protein
MKPILYAFGAMAMVCCTGGPSAAGGGADEGTTVVRDANGTVTITQSGDPARASVDISRSPGRTTVVRRSGNNSAIVTESTNPADLPQDLIDFLRGKPPP